MFEWTKEEIAAELARRKQVQLDRKKDAEKVSYAPDPNADTRCVHCNQPYNSLAGGSHGFCRSCIDGD